VIREKWIIHLKSKTRRSGIQFVLTDENCPEMVAQEISHEQTGPKADASQFDSKTNSDDAVYVSVMLSSDID
jgi:hypothetical protein